MTKLLEIIEDGLPVLRSELSAEIRQYHQFRAHLSSFDGVALYITTNA